MKEEFVRAYHTKVRLPSRGEIIHLLEKEINAKGVESRVYEAVADEFEGREKPAGGVMLAVRSVLVELYPPKECTLTQSRDLVLLGDLIILALLGGELGTILLEGPGDG